MNDKEIKHYGVPGMKWGYRKTVGIVSTQPRSKKQQDYIDSHSINPNASIKKANNTLLGKILRGEVKKDGYGDTKALINGRNFVDKLLLKIKRGG